MRVIARAIGWRPRASVEEGFGRLVAWLRGEPALLRRYQRLIEGAA